MPILEGASNFTISGYARLYEIHGDAVINQLNTDELKKIQLIANLPRAHAGPKDYETTKKSGLCFPGTREALLREMMDWVTGPGESRMYALSGLAGIGKSTVVYTVATQADKRGLLGASFFFSRDDTDCRTAKRFFTTIAYQLCLFSEEFARAIVEVLNTERGSTATTASPQEQLQTLILDPLRAVITPNTPQTLIVVDALDECYDGDVPSVLSGLRQLVQAFPSFKVILTTRPHLNDYFTSQDGQKIFHLQDIEDKVVNRDIRLYLRHSLSLEQVRTQLQDPTIRWSASDAEIESLVKAAGKLFIIASMAVRFILDKSWSDPADQMEELLRAFAQNHTPFDNLHDFYTIILQRAIPADCRNPRLIERYQAVVGAIVLIRAPLSIDTLAALIGIKANHVSVVLRQLHSIILVRSDNIPIVYHKSFVDYITDAQRCMDINIRIDPRIRHTWIALRCFEMMDKYLKYNILGLGTPARFMNNEDGLAKDGITDGKLQNIIPPGLQYACAYWGDHFNSANIQDAELMNNLENFANAHLLHWLEILSFIRKLDSAHPAIHAVLKHLEPTSSDFHQLLSNVLRFIAKFYKIIERSALHTYYSALPFTPADTIFYHRYINSEAMESTCHIIGRPDKWDYLIANLNHGEWVNGVQFSQDNTMLSSQSKKGDRFKGMLNIWDAITGAPISSIRGGGFAISNDFSTVASFKDNIITLYNKDGSEQGTTFTTPAKIFQAAISSENNRIAAILYDGTLRLWDSVNGELMGGFGHIAGNYPDKDGDRLYFSSTGARLAYLLPDGVIELRDGIDGILIANLDCKPFNLNSRIAFSRDGSRIACFWPDLKLWRCEDGGLIGIAKKAGDDSDELAISANGFLVATRSDRMLKLWSGNGGNPLPLVEVLDLFPLAVAFSSDDTLAIVTNNGMTLYNVTNRTLVSTLSFSGGSGGPVAFSPNCTRLAAGNMQGTLYLWDIQFIELSASCSDKQTSGKVTCLSLSPNCSRVACGFHDGVIELWEIDGLAKQRIATHRHHRNRIMALEFSPDGERFASGSYDGTINVWEGNSGELRGTLQYPIISGWLYAMGVKVSNSMVGAVANYGIILWDSKTLDHIYTFEGDFVAFLSFSPNGALLATASDTASNDGAPLQIIVLDVATRTTTTTFIVPSGDIRAMAFSQDSSHLVVQLYIENFFTFNLIDAEDVIRGPTFEHFIQLSNISLWHGVPVWVNMEYGQYCLKALFSQLDDPVPVLWIPPELSVRKWSNARSMIAMGCEDGRLLLLRLPSSHVMGKHEGVPAATGATTPSNSINATAATRTTTMPTAIYSSYQSYDVPAQQTVQSPYAGYKPPIQDASLPYDENTYAPAIPLSTSRFLPIMQPSQLAQGLYRLPSSQRGASAAGVQLVQPSGSDDSRRNEALFMTNNRALEFSFNPYSSPPSQGYVSPASTGLTRLPSLSRPNSGLQQRAWQQSAPPPSYQEGHLPLIRRPISTIDIPSTHRMQRQSTPSQYGIPSGRGVPADLGRMSLAPEQLPHTTRQARRGAQQEESSSHRHNIYASTTPPPSYGRPGVDPQSTLAQQHNPPFLGPYAPRPIQHHQYQFYGSTGSLNRRSGPPDAPR